MKKQSYETVEMEIGPVLAAQMLLKNTKNRSLTQARVDLFASEMAAGNWKFNGETIKFDETGRLVDGQHRLLAIIKSKKTIRCLVVKGLGQDVFDSIDVGGKRTPGQIFSIRGEKNANQLAATLNFYWRMTNNRMIGGNSKDGVSAILLEKTLDENPTMRDSVHFIVCQKGLKTLLNASVAASLHYLFARKDAQLAELFFQSLATGANLKENDSVYLLRERLLSNRVAKAKLPIYLAAITIKAWNLLRANKGIRYLGWRDAEEFPTIK
jgi:hypothetical protein